VGRTVLVHLVFLAADGTFKFRGSAAKDLGPRATAQRQRVAVGAVDLVVRENDTGKRHAGLTPPAELGNC